MEGAGAGPNTSDGPSRTSEAAKCPRSSSHDSTEPNPKLGSSEVLHTVSSESDHERKKAEAEEQKRKEDEKKELTKKIMLRIRDEAETTCKRLQALIDSPSSKSELTSVENNLDQCSEITQEFQLAVLKAEAELAVICPNSAGTQVRTPSHRRSGVISLAMFESYFPLILQVQDIMREFSPNPLDSKLRNIEHRLLRLLKFYGANESVFMHYNNKVGASDQVHTNGNDYTLKTVEAWDKIQTFPHKLNEFGIRNDHEKVGAEEFGKRIEELKKALVMERSKARSGVPGQPPTSDVPIPVTSSNSNPTTSTIPIPLDSAQDSGSGAGTMTGSLGNASESTYNEPASGFPPLSNHGIIVFPAPDNSETPNPNVYYMAGIGSNGLVGIVRPPATPRGGGRSLGGPPKSPVSGDNQPPSHGQAHGADMTDTTTGTAQPMVGGINMTNQM